MCCVAVHFIHFIHKIIQFELILFLCCYYYYYCTSYFFIVVVYSTLKTLCLFKLCYINKVDWIGYIFKTIFYLYIKY